MAWLNVFTRAPLPAKAAKGAETKRQVTGNDRKPMPARERVAFPPHCDGRHCGSSPFPSSSSRRPAQPSSSSSRPSSCPRCSRRAARGRAVGIDPRPVATRVSLRPTLVRLRPMEEAAIRCAERGRSVDEFTAIAERWGRWSDGCGELIPMCPECARREFAPDAPASGRLPRALLRAANSSGSSSRPSRARRANRAGVLLRDDRPRGRGRRRRRKALGIDALSPSFRRSSAGTQSAARGVPYVGAQAARAPAGR